MKLALAITEENMDSIQMWNGGVEPDAEVTDKDFWLVTDTGNDNHNEIISLRTLVEQFEFETLLPHEFSEVKEK